ASRERDRCPVPGGQLTLPEDIAVRGIERHQHRSESVCAANAFAVSVRGLTAGAGASAVVASDNEPLAVVRAIVEDAADQGTAGADLAAPDDIAGHAVKRPEHA